MPGSAKISNNLCPIMLDKIAKTVLCALVPAFKSYVALVMIMDVLLIVSSVALVTIQTFFPTDAFNKAPEMISYADT